MNVNDNGRKWARTFLLIALGVSVVGNITHTWLAESTISLWLRVPGAVVWPLFTWGAIEIVVRVVWQQRHTHNFARTMVLLPAVPAAITSYEHLYNLLGLMGERDLIQWIGPAAIDGLMIGCTLTLLFTREEIKEIVETIAPVSASALQSVSFPLDTVETTGGIYSHETELPVPVSPAPVSPGAPRAPRAPRISWDAAKVIDMILENSGKSEIIAATGISPASLGRLMKVTNMLRKDARADIDSKSEKVRPEHVTMIRKALLS